MYLRRIRSRRSGTATAGVIVARLGDDRLWEEVLDSGAYDLITEPYEAREVTRIIERALNSRALERPASTRTKSSS